MTYDDGEKLTCCKQDVCNALDVRGLPAWSAAYESLAAAFKYLEDRLTDSPSVDQPYRLRELYSVCSAIRSFNPEFIRLQAAEGQTAEIVERLKDIPWLAEEAIQQMQSELPALVLAANESKLDFSAASVTDFSSNVLTFWRNIINCNTWKQEARRAFSLTPSSASSERVFSLLKAMFGENQINSLSDYIEGSVMLAFNERQLG